MSSNGEARGLFAGGPHWLFGPRIIIIAVALLPFVSARSPLSLSFSLSFPFAPLAADLRSGRCIATRIGLSLYPVGHEERPVSREHGTIGPSGPRTEGTPRTEERSRRARKMKPPNAARRVPESNGEARGTTDATKDGERGHEARE